jgi:hypothetical protein
MNTVELKPCKGWSGLFTMLMYYEDDKQSQELIRRNRPSDLYLLPDIYIRLNKDNPANITVVKVWPNRQETKFICANIRAVDNLRKLYTNKKSPWSHYRDGRFVVFHLVGRVFCDRKAAIINKLNH